MSKDTSLQVAAGMGGSNDRGDLELAEIAAKLWMHKWLGVCLVLSFLCLAAVYLHHATYLYTAKMVLTPADQGTQIDGKLGALGSIMGVDLGSEQSSAFSMYSEATQSYPVADRLSRDPRIMRTLFAAEWDAPSSRWREPKSRIGGVIAGLKRILGAPSIAWRPPGPQDLQQVIAKNVIIGDADEKAIIEMSFQHENPEFAKYFLYRLNEASDDFLRRKSLRRTSSYIGYLERRLQQVNVAEYRKSLLDQIAAYEKTRMMASSDVSFAAETFGDVLVSQRPTSPRPTIVLLVALGLSAVLWLSYVLVVKDAVDLAKRGRVARTGSAAG